MAMLTSDTVDVRAKDIIRDKKGNFIMMKGTSLRRYDNANCLCI